MPEPEPIREWFTLQASETSDHSPALGVHLGLVLLLEFDRQRRIAELYYVVDHLAFFGSRDV